MDRRIYPLNEPAASRRETRAPEEDRGGLLPRRDRAELGRRMDGCRKGSAEARWSWFIGGARRYSGACSTEERTGGVPAAARLYDERPSCSRSDDGGAARQ
jgi:hypothetical protein